MDNIFLQLYNAMSKQNSLEKWMKGCIFSFPKKDNFGITKNYRNITLIAIAATVYKSLFLNCIPAEVMKIIRKNQNDFLRNQSTSLLLKIC